MNKKGSMSLITLAFILIVISLITGCSLKEKFGKNQTALETCEKDRAGFEVLYNSEKERECKPETITVYKNITQNCTKVINETYITIITTDLDECEKDRDGFKVLYELEKNRECEPETITIYKNITQNCTEVVNENCTIIINESQINNSYIIMLIQQAQYWEELAEDCYFYNESERNINLTNELEVCEGKLEDIEEVIG